MTTTEMFRRDENTLAFPAGQTIFSEGEKGDSMYVVVEGEVNLVVHGTLVETLPAGGMFGEMALLAKEPRTATAVASTDCKLTPIDSKRFMYLIQQTPYFALQMMQVMADRLRRMDSRL
jgi:CRP-like cAMP-binding protein